MLGRVICQGCPINFTIFILVDYGNNGYRRSSKQEYQRYIPIEENELKIYLLADDSTCILDGSQGTFDNLFATLNKFANCSG